MMAAVPKVPLTATLKVQTPNPEPISAPMPVPTPVPTPEITPRAEVNPTLPPTPATKGLCCVQLVLLLHTWSYLLAGVMPALITPPKLAFQADHVPPGMREVACSANAHVCDD